MGRVLPNFLATLLGAIIGIPIAIGTNNYLERAAQKERWNKILPLLREELLVNMTQLASWQKSPTQKIETVNASFFLETGSWDVFSASGELIFAKDPIILNKLSYAYSSIRILKQLTERYMEIAHLTNEREKELLSAHVAELLSKGIDVAIEDVRTAFKAF